MTFNEIINYSLISHGKIDISVFDILMVLIVFFITILIVRIIKRIFKKLVKKGTIDGGSSNSIFQIIRYILWIISIGLMLEIIGFKLTILIAGSAALLVGFGLGIQQIFNDFASGLILLFERNLKVNDIVQLENDIVGKVLVIGLRTTKINTRDNIVMIVPNSKFTNDSIINWSHSEDTTRFEIEIGVAYGSDVPLVKKTLLKCASQHPGTLTDPEPFVRFTDFGNSSLDFQLFFWTNLSFDSENIKSDLRFVIDDEFRKKGVQIPFPQTDIHIKK